MDKPYLFPHSEDRTTLEIRKSNNTTPDIVVKIFIDGMLYNNVFCNQISVYAGKPPTYCLKAGGVDILGLAAKHVTVHKDIASELGINEDTIKALGKKWIELVD